MKTLEELIKEPRWPHEMDGYPVRWNRGEGLIELCNNVFNLYHPGNIIVDVGVARGISTEIFSHFGTVYGVDHHIWSETDRFASNPRITLIHGNSMETARNWLTINPNRMLDLCYLDSCHDEDHVVEEIKAWMPNVKPGGCIGGHDFNLAFTGVQAAVMKVLGGADHVYSDSSWIKRL